MIRNKCHRASFLFLAFFILVVPRVVSAQSDEQAKILVQSELQNPKKPELSSSRATRGRVKAPITIVEYSDFQCPYCKRGWETVEEVRAKYGDKVFFMFKHMPLEFHPFAMPAAKHFEAIALQNKKKAYEFHDEVYKNQAEFTADSEKFMAAVETKLKLNMKRLKKDIDSDAVKKRIDADIAEAKGFGFTGTPGFVVNGVAIRGAYPASFFDQVIQLTQAAKAEKKESKEPKGRG